jgi:hypothetical protein
MNLKVKYLGEIEVLFEMALGNEPGYQVGSIHEKNQRSKISWDYPFNIIKILTSLLTFRILANSVVILLL